MCMNIISYLKYNLIIVVYGNQINYFLLTPKPYLLPIHKTRADC